MRISALALAAILLIGCSEPATNAGDDEALYQSDTTVLEAHGTVRLCLGGVNDSLPPQCDGVPMVGWSWDDVEGEQTSRDVTWGEFHVVGTYDGSTFTLTHAGSPHEDAEGSLGLAPPCPEPEGGWVAVDPSMTGNDAVVAVMRAAEDDAGYAGLWVGHSSEQGAGAHADVLTVAFTKDPTQHEAEIREVYGGPLCLTSLDYTYAELLRTQHELSDGGAERLGLQMTWSDVDVMHNQVVLGAVVSDSSIQSELDSTYGPGLVRVDAALRPV
jgi:hypothetical protein